MCVQRFISHPRVNADSAKKSVVSGGVGVNNQQPLQSSTRHNVLSEDFFQQGTRLICNIDY